MRVRIGVHTGEPLLTKAGYVGMDVHRAARIAAAGHGGQVLLSQATRDLLVEADDVVDLGEHRLRDLTRPERLYQLGDGAFPPLRSLNRVEAARGRTSARRPDGRAARAGRAAAPAAARDDHRCRRDRQDPARAAPRRRALGRVPGRRSLRLAGGAFRPGARADGDAAGARPARRRTAPEHHRALLVLDNFEHVREAAPAVARFLRRSSGPTLLVTSRIPLHVSMETEYPLDPLPLAACGGAVPRPRAGSVETHAAVRRGRGDLQAARRAAARPRARSGAAEAARSSRPARAARLAAWPCSPAGRAICPSASRRSRRRSRGVTTCSSRDAQAVFARLSVFAGTFDVEAAEVGRRSRPRGCRDPRRREPAQATRRQPVPDARDDS